MRKFTVASLLALTALSAAPAQAGIVVPLAATTTAGSSANRVTGSDREADEVRPMPSFSAIRVNGPIDVVLKPSDREQVTVHFDDNLLQAIETRVAGVQTPTLEIQLAPGAAFRSGNSPRVTVEYKTLTALTLRGSGDVTATSVTVPVLAVSIAGSGDVTIERLEVGTLGVALAGSGDFTASGRATEQGFSIAGSGDINARNLIGQTVKVRIAGSGDASVHAEQTLEAIIAGSGSVVYRGTPIIRKSVAGSGEVRAAR
jgi:hypothetical protein